MDPSRKWNGVYQMLSIKNAREFMAKFKIPEKKLDIILAMEITNELTINGNAFCLKQRSGDITNEISSTIGKRDNFQTIDGLKLTGTITLDEKADLRGKYDQGIEEYMRFTADDVVTDTVTYDGVSMIRTFRKVNQ